MFYSGNFSSFSSLKTSVEAALVDNGWSLNQGILSKGTGVFRLTATATELLLEAGAAQLGTELENPAPSGVKIMDYLAAPFAFPATYELHVLDSPDEVYLVVNYNADRYQQLSFGVSDVAQIGGTGAWFTGSFRSTIGTGTNGLVYLNTADSSIGVWGAQLGLGFFFATYNGNSGGSLCSYIHTGLDSVGWKFNGDADGTLAGSGDQMAGLLHSLPSQFNQNTVLLPLNAVQRRLSQGQTIVASLRHARLCRIDNHLAGEVVPYGGESWKVYPMHRKNADQRDGVQWSTGAEHSGTFGFAVRYTGA